MHEKKVAVLCGRSLTAARAQKLFEHMDVTVQTVDAVSASHGAEALASADLIVWDFSGMAGNLDPIEHALGTLDNLQLLALVDERQMDGSAFPLRTAQDFASAEASDDEIKIRCRKILWPGEMTTDDDFLHLGALTINLATYQVKVSDQPVDLTFMEYSLLLFLAQHPGRIHSREVLLSQVWGFDYYGGSRTVDVHVRRLRSKLGPEVAQHIQTVRGVGYLWAN
jgi:DNA-binding response OmpR family regulator